MKPQDWTLLAISAAKGRGLSPIQLQKSLFLLERRLSKEELGEQFYEFVPYNYGPFDVKIYQDAKYLDEVVTWILGLSFRDLVRAIYEAYPQFRANSVFQE